MEFVTGVTKRDDWCIADLAAAPEHSRGKIRGAVHNIRNMGEISFLILRRYDGLVQCVFEEMNSGFSLRSLKEGATVEAEGISRRESRAPGGTELRLTGLRILSEPVEPMPLPISKWKMNTSLEALLNTRPVSLRNLRERAKFRIQETSPVLSGISCTARTLRKSIRRRSEPAEQRAERTFSVWTIFIIRRCWHRALSFTNR